METGKLWYRDSESCDGCNKDLRIYGQSEFMLGTRTKRRDGGTITFRYCRGNGLEIGCSWHQKICSSCCNDKGCRCTLCSRELYNLNYRRFNNPSQAT